MGGGMAGRATERAEACCCLLARPLLTPPLPFSQPEPTLQPDPGF